MPQLGRPRLEWNRHSRLFAVQHRLVGSDPLDRDLALVEREELGYRWRVRADYKEA